MLFFYIHTIKKKQETKEEFKSYLKMLDVKMEEKIRDNWLRSLVMLNILCLIETIVSPSSFSKFTLETKILMIVVSIFCSLCGSIILYHYSLKKRGKALLLLVVTVGLIATIFDFTEKYKNFNNSLYAVYYIFIYVFQFYYFYVSVKLYKINSNKIVLD